jgi:hypothetical protein
VTTAELVSLAKLRGLDLSSIPGIDLGATGKRGKGHEELLAGVEVVPTAEGQGGPGARQPYRSSAAVYDRDDPPWLAARYSFAADERAYWPLWNALVFQAQRLARREDWSPQVRGARGELQFYLLELATLVLDEQAARPLFVAAPVLYALYMRVEPETWQQVLEPRYRSLCGCYARWLDVARQTIGRWCEEGPQPLCGELLKEMAQTGQRDNGKGNRNPDLKSQDAIPKLEDLGLTKDESSRFQQIAAVPEEPETISEDELVAELSALLHEEPQALPAARAAG